MVVPPYLAALDTRIRDIKGGFDYGRWYLQNYLHTPFNTPVLANTNHPGPTVTMGVTYPGLIIAETGILRVIVAENTGVVFSLALTRGWPTAPVQVVMAYNAGAALAANCLYMFDVPVLAGDIVNFQFGANTTILMCDAHLVLMMGP